MVFHKHVLDPHQIGFAAGELIAHVNYMLVEGRLTAEEVRRRAALPDDLIRSAATIPFNRFDPASIAPGDKPPERPSQRAVAALIRIR